MFNIRIQCMEKIEHFMYSNVQFLLVLVLSSPKTKFQMKGFDHVMSVVRSSVRLSVSLFVNYSVFFFKTTESNLTELCSKHRYWKGTLKCLNKRQYIFFKRDNYKTVEIGCLSWKSSSQEPVHYLCHYLSKNG